MEETEVRSTSSYGSKTLICSWLSSGMSMEEKEGKLDGMASLVHRAKEDEEG